MSKAVRRGRGLVRRSSSLGRTLPGISGWSCSAAVPTATRHAASNATELPEIDAEVNSPVSRRIGAMITPAQYRSPSLRQRHRLNSDLPPSKSGLHLSLGRIRCPLVPVRHRATLRP
jgi:hypothetical protein